LPIRQGEQASLILPLCWCTVTWQDKHIDLYVVFHNPADFSGKYAFRAQTAASKPRAIGTTLAQVRTALPEELARLERDPSDVPSILEVWI